MDDDILVVVFCGFGCVWCWVVDIDVVWIVGRGCCELFAWCWVSNDKAEMRW